MEVSNQFHASTALPLGEKADIMHCIEGWVGPSTALDVMEKGKSCCSSKN
jgi:hypothetical protein